MTTAAGPWTRDGGCRDERGISSLEVLGIMLVAGSVVGALAFTLGAEPAGERMGSAFCSITEGEDCSGAGGSTQAGSGEGERCIGAPAGAAGPVRGRVDVAGSHVTSVGVMGDGTYQVYAREASADGSASAPTGWVDRHLSPGAAAGVEPMLSGRADAVFTARGPQQLADLIAADSRQGWSDSVFGADTSGIGEAASSIGDFVMSRAGDGETLPAPSATFTDTSAEAGLSLNAYAQTLALDAGGEAVGVVEHANGATTEVVGVSENTTAGSEVVPMLLQVDRDPSGNVTAVRTVTDRDLSGEDLAASASLYVTHLDTAAAGADTALRDFASSIGAVNLTAGSAGSGGVNSSGSASTPDFRSSASAFTEAALRNGYVNRQAPAGTVSTGSATGAEAIESGLRQVAKSSPPESFNGNDWTTRTPGCQG